MVAVHAAVAEIQSMASQADRTSRQKCKYTELLTELMDSLIPPSSSSAPTTSLVSFVSEMKALVDHLLSPQVSTLVSRSVFAHLGQSLLERLPRQGKYACSEEQLQALQDVAEYALEQGGSHTQAFEEADTSVREFLFEHLKAQGCYRSAASVLAGMNMDASTRPLSEDAKADIYVKIAETFLVEDQAVEAEAFVNRASGLMEAVTDYWVQLRYRVTYAKVLDANRKFLEAALRYHELSQTQRREDERTSALETLEKHGAHATVLEKTHREQILSRAEMGEFAGVLQEHQRVRTSDGFTILEKAIIEHNVVAASKVYDNIRISELGRLLKIAEDEAERVAARMIGEGRLKGCIDQTEGLLHFEGGGEGGKEGGKGGEAGALLQNWDERIAGACQEVNAILEEAGKTLPGVLIGE
ncbi:hypothetical protein NSK_008686 [Nannochloropsis salina CCMP1776]|uniref:COP9 signalosome complex subunit 4 n=1 Tax=Nannochloropsis salina CCMP1776 TaxID=1027361 RepID=A0A4D9CTT1_9STRA|nr:hypothetical protein NSK_008686 [Nannochloropsis salina CCMP1776]|eukprot:TFJ80129.1 hypothetical protein NSK_008686 [Nannochloropsis salina CCMP1776]